MIFAATAALASVSYAQQQPQRPEQPLQRPDQPERPQQSQSPQVRINYLNVCTPSDKEQKELSSALSRVPGDAHFSADFEISRGRTTVEENTPANWVRIRRDFAGSPLSTVQYSFSVDEKGTNENIVFHTREQKDLMQVLIEDTIMGPSSPSSVVGTDTPVDRIRIERMGKPSVALARCPNVDQRVYEPLFRKASELMRSYRGALNVKTTVPRELAVLPVASNHAKNNEGSAK